MQHLIASSCSFLLFVAGVAAHKDTVRVSLTATGAQSAGATAAVAISADGRYVAFQSAASNLVAGDTNGLSDVLIAEVSTFVLSRVSVDRRAVQAHPHLIGATFAQQVVVRDAGANAFGFVVSNAADGVVGY